MNENLLSYARTHMLPSIPEIEGSSISNVYVYLIMLLVLILHAPEERPEMSDISPLSGISGLSFDSPVLSPLLFFSLVLLLFLSCHFSANVHSPAFFPCMSWVSC